MIFKESFTDAAKLRNFILFPDLSQKTRSFSQLKYEF